MQAIFTVSGEPEGKARPRVTRNGTYTPPKTQAYEKLVQMSFRTQCPGVFFGDAPLCVYITANFAPPQSATKRKRSRMLSGEIRPTKKPDTDNIAKAICDALNGVAYRDDAQICSLTVQKQYSEMSAVTVRIYSEPYD